MKTKNRFLTRLTFLPLIVCLFGILSLELNQNKLIGETSNKRDVLQANIIQNLMIKLFQKDNQKSFSDTELTAALKAEKRILNDPFIPSDLKLGNQNNGIRSNPLDGILVNMGTTYALMQGRYLKKGDRIFGMRVILIQNNKVILASNRRIRVYTLF